jgi:type IV secretory pathway protease TraF
VFRCSEALILQRMKMGGLSHVEDALLTAGLPDTYDSRYFGI